jgi:hypothetical protein
MRIAFPALIKSISVKSLVSGDKEGEIRLRFLPTDEVMDALQRLHRADEEVMVGIVELSENTDGISHEIQKRSKRKSQGKTEGSENQAL